MFGRTRLKILKKKLFTKKKAHFIHIGKTGGTAIANAMKGHWNVGKYDIQYHGHKDTLHDISKNEKFFFCVRDPQKKFVSGFYSRKRQGKPAGFYPWSEQEKEAFKNFETPNELAESLSSSDDALKEMGIEAMNCIGHVNSSYWDNFIDTNTLISRKRDVLMVLSQSNLNSDFETLKRRLQLGENVKLSIDPKKAHSTPENSNRFLSDLAQQNLITWYKKEYEFLEELKKLNLIK